MSKLYPSDCLFMAARYLRDSVPTQLTLRSNNLTLLSVPRTRLKIYGDQAFEAVAPKLCPYRHCTLGSERALRQFKCFGAVLIKLN